MKVMTGVMKSDGLGEKKEKFGDGMGLRTAKSSSSSALGSAQTAH